MVDLTMNATKKNDNTLVLNTNFVKALSNKEKNNIQSKLSRKLQLLKRITKRTKKFFNIQLMENITPIIVYENIVSLDTPTSSYTPSDT